MVCRSLNSSWVLIATTSGSADSAAAADWTPLANRNVIIWPDNDAAGLQYAQTVTEQLRALNCQCNGLILPL